MFKDYYTILGVTWQATHEEIKRAYRSKSMQFHPDKNPDKNVTLLMQDINEAYAILKDEDKRARYDSEYSIFRKQFSHDTTSKPNDEAENRYEHSSKYEYDYHVQDETLQRDINNARAYAERLVKDFFDSLKDTSKTAVKGAVKGVTPYLLPYLIAALILTLIGMIGRLAFANTPRIDYTDARVDNYISNETQSSQIKMLPVFNAPSSWTQYSINGIFELAVPSTVELRSQLERNTYRQQDKKVLIVSDKVIFQQRGLRKALENSGNIDSNYCRIMIQYWSAQAGTFPRSNEIVELDYETMQDLRKMVMREFELNPQQKLLEGPTYKLIDVNGQKAIEVKYRRSGNKNYTTACTFYLLFNYDKMTRITISYREQNKDKWLPDLNNVIRTFKWQ